MKCRRLRSYRARFVFYCLPVSYVLDVGMAFDLWLLCELELQITNACHLPNLWARLAA